MEMNSIDVPKTDLQKGVEQLKQVLHQIPQQADSIFIIPFTFNGNHSWFKVDLTQPQDVQIIHFNEHHQSALPSVRAAFAEFLSHYQKGNFLEYDRAFMLEGTQQGGLRYLPPRTEEFVKSAPRIREDQYASLSVLSAEQVRANIEPAVKVTKNPLSMFFRKKPTEKKSVPAEDVKSDKTKSGPQ